MHANFANNYFKVRLFFLLNSAGESFGRLVVALLLTSPILLTIDLAQATERSM
jgi:hypothetical protein